jgi:flagellar protein FliL
VSAKAEAPTDTPPKSPAKNKKLVIIIGAVVLLVAIAGGGAFFYISKQRAAAAAAEEGEEPVAEVSQAESHDAEKKPPAYLPLDNMVVNLADPGGERVAQIGITLEVTDAKAADTVKSYLPTIRSGILLLISQRTAEELLSADGKQKLAKDILRQALLPFGGMPEEEHSDTEETPKKKKKTAKKAEHADLPVKNVLFSSFIVQ